MANKVKYGLSKVYYSVWTESTDTYATPVAMPGAVSLSVDQEGETTKFRADNVDYFVTVSNNGYSGTLELALIPDSFATDVLCEGTDATSGLQYELANVVSKPFALLFQFEGDDSATRHVLYNCKASRPSIAGSTTEESIEPQTDTLNIVASPRPTDYVVKAKCDDDASAYATFFSAVAKPTV